MNKTANHSSDIGFLMTQTLYGEACGVSVLKKLCHIFDKFPTTDLSSQITGSLKTQIEDEVRHANTYSHLLRSKKFGDGHKPSETWQQIMYGLQRQDNPFNIICTIHLLIEPFTKAVVEDLIIGNLESAESEKISKIIEEEESHISLGSDLIEFCKRKEIGIASAKAFRNEAKHFISIHSEGISNPATGTRFKISKKARSNFMESVSESFKLLSST